LRYIPLYLRENNGRKRILPRVCGKGNRAAAGVGVAVSPEIFMTDLLALKKMAKYS
jgi:hypothetical protein